MDQNYLHHPELDPVLLRARSMDVVARNFKVPLGVNEDDFWNARLTSRLMPTRYADEYIFSARGRLLRDDLVAERILSKMYWDGWHLPRSTDQLRKLIGQSLVFASGPFPGDFANASEIRLVTEENLFQDAVCKRRVRGKFNAIHGPFFEIVERPDARHTLLNCYQNTVLTANSLSRYQVDPIVACSFASGFCNYEHDCGLKAHLANFGMKPVDILCETNLRNDLNLSGIVNFFVAQREAFAERPEMIVGIRDGSRASTEADFVIHARTTPVRREMDESQSRVDSKTVMIHSPDLGESSSKLRIIRELSNRTGMDSEPVFMLPGFSLKWIDPLQD